MRRKLIYNVLKAFGSLEARALEAESRDPRGYQLARLMSIISGNRNSAFGQKHCFGSIGSLADFRSAVPIRDYDQFKPYIDRIVAGQSSVLTSEDPVFLATTSGTTGAQKFIPVTRQYLREFRRSSTVSGYHLLDEFPQVSRGICLSVFSPAVSGFTSGGLPWGSISGQLYTSEPAAIKNIVAPVPYAVYTIPDYEARYYTLLRLAISQPVSCLYTLNPSTIVLLARKLRQWQDSLIRDLHDGSLNAPVPLPSKIRESLSTLIRPDRAKARQLAYLSGRESLTPEAVWPQLAFISCWIRAAAAFYLPSLREHFGSTPIRDISYGASEGRGTAYIGQNRQVLSIRSHFFEFIPEEEIDASNPPVYLCDELTEGRSYYIIFTTSAGLYRYHINDVVRVTGFHNRTPLIDFQHKGGNICSFTGEKLTESQVTAAMTAALEETGQSIRFFSVIPEFHPQPHYRLVVEPSAENTRESTVASELGRCFEEYLCKSNIEYREKRASLRLGAVKCEILAAGAYERLRRELVASGTPDAQVKVSHLNPRQEIKCFLERNIRNYALPQGTTAGSQPTASSANAAAPA